MPNITTEINAAHHSRAAEFSKNSGPKNLNFSPPQLAAPFNSGRPTLFIRYELCTRAFAPAAFNPADRSHFHGHRGAFALDPRDHLFGRIDPSHVYPSCVDPDLPNAQSPLISLRLA
jgi:hypothetical protein